MKGQLGHLLPENLSKVLVGLLACFILDQGFGSEIGQAQTAPPITSSGLNTTVIQNGTTFNITGGTRPGNGVNLFHSFGQFNVPTNNIANFLNGGSVDLAGHTLANGLLTNNILARVTDPNPSSIFGTIQTNGIGGFDNANLFLMNPAGIVFGPNATLNVGGSVTFTTANYLRLAEADGRNAGIFHADTQLTSILSNAPVAAFGFLGSNPVAIAVQGSILTVQSGQSLSLVGGNQGLPASVPNGVTMTGGKLSAPSGQINLASVASPGEVSAVDFMPAAGMTRGNISLSQGAILDVSGNGGGTVRIRAGQFVMDQSAVVANTTGASDGAPTAISVNVTDGASLDNQSALYAWATNAGRSGDIKITGSTIDVAGGSFVYTQSTDSGSPGNITVTGSESISVRGDQFGNPSEILSDSLGSASTGSIALRAPLITLSDMGAIETRMFGSGPGARTGDIIVEATNLNLLNGGMIHTTSGTDIASGNISITAQDSINLVGTNGLTEPSNITNESISGGTGSITIHTGSLTLSEQARINSQTWFDTDPAAANTPKIAITADSSITLSTGSRIDVGGFISDTGRLELSAQNLTMSGTSAITTFSNASGASGPIVINVQDLTVSEGSQILSSSGQGFGRGGDITVNATGSVLVTGQGADPFGGIVASGIFSNTMAGFEDPSFTGNAGNISISGHSIEVSHGARVDSSSQFFALGNAGNIDLTAPTITVNGGTISTSTEFAGQGGTIALHANTVTLNNGGKLTSSSTIRQTPSFDGEVIPSPTGNGGDINIAASQSVTLTNGSTISASSTGPGNAGNIQINAGQQLDMRDSSIKTEAAHAIGGDIDIQAIDRVRLVNSTISTSVLGESGSGGNISIDPNVVVLQNSQIIAQAVQGAGGNITITTPLFLADQTSLVSASSQFGLSGTVTIQSPTSNLSGSVGSLPSSMTQQQALQAQRCAALYGGASSSFVIAGRDTIPTEPGGWLASPLGLQSLGRGLLAETTIDEPRPTTLVMTQTSDPISLRRLTPAGFLTQRFAGDGSDGCRS